jgi:hypothetical protein
MGSLALMIATFSVQSSLGYLQKCIGFDNDTSVGLIRELTSDAARTATQWRAGTRVVLRVSLIVIPLNQQPNNRRYSYIL